VPPSYFDGAEVVLSPLDQRRPLPRDGNSARASLWGQGWQVQASSLYARPVRHPG